MIEGEFEEEEPTSPISAPPVPSTPAPALVDEEKKKLQKTASLTNLKAAEILESLKKSSRPPKT